MGKAGIRIRWDLWAGDVVDEAHAVQRSWRDSASNRLRFDPTELHQTLLPAHFEIDWIKLTAIDEANANGIFPIKYDVQADLPVDLTVYYDTDTNPANGRTLITTISATVKRLIITPNTAVADHFLYLPFIVNPPGPCGDDSACYEWDTSGIAPGTYHVCMQIEDAYNSNYRCSDAPMKIQ